MTRSCRISGIVAAAFLGAGAITFSSAGIAQLLTLAIEIRGANPDASRPKGQVNTLQELMGALAGCWRAPPADPARGPVDVIFQVSFKRSGELFGKPRVIQFVRALTPEQRGSYDAAVAEALDRCSPMPFTDSMGGAVAGRVFRVNFIDMRNRKQAEVPWLTTKTS